MTNPESERPRPRITAAILRDIGLFGGLDDETLQVLARELPTETVEVGQVVVEEGDTTREMFVVIGGELEVVKHAKSGQEVRVALFGPGDWFGEMSILDVQPRSATVRAVAPTMLVRMNAEHVDRLLYRRDMKAFSLLLMNVARELSRRLRVADGIIAQMMTSVSDAFIAAHQRTTKGE
ncbi:MAG: cyclic nucleotide-binding domain-containing protein [Polyangiales bacterium]